MADHLDSKKFGSVVAFGPFTAANITTGLTNSDLAYGQQTYAVMPYGGSVVGVSGCVNAAVTAGTATLRAHSSGTECAATGYPAPAVSSAATASYATVRPGAVTFSAGDRLGISVTTVTTLNPTNTLEIDGFLFVQFNAS